MVLALAFLVIGFVFVGVTVYANDASNFTCTDSDNMPAFYYAQEGYDLAQPLLCSDSCKCNISNDDVKNALLTNAPDMLTHLDSTGATQVQQCSTYNTEFSNSDIRNEISWIQFLENSF